MRLNISMHFTGFVEKIIEEAVRKGVVKTKAEALRLGLLELNEKYCLVPTRLEEIELAEDLKEIERIERDLASGKEKIHRVKNVDDLFK